MEDNGNPHKDRDKRVSGVCMCVHVTVNFRKSVYYRFALAKCSLICCFYMFGRSENIFSRFADTFVTDYEFGYADGAHCLGVLVNLVGQFGRQWQMVWNCPLGDG